MFPPPRLIRIVLLLAGSIPPELGQLAALEKLYLGRNRLTGETFYRFHDESC